MEPFELMQSSKRFLYAIIPDLSIQSQEKKKDPLSIVLISFLIGGLLGCLAPIEQDATVPALVLAGKILVKPDTVLGQYFFGSWTLVNQIGAEFLRLGFSQKGLDYFYCFTLVGLRISGCAMLIYGLSRWALFSTLSAVMIFLTGIFGQDFIPPDYSGGWLDITLPHSGTYGGYAYALSAFVIGALAVQRNVLAGMTSAILIAVHPVVGAYVSFLLIAIIIISKKINLNNLNIDTKGILRGFSIGALITLTSLGTFLATSPHIQKQPLNKELYEAYLKYWDYHRSFPLHTKTVLLTLLAGTVFWIFLKISKKEDSGAQCATAVMLLSVPISLFFYLLIDSFPIAWRYRFIPQLVLQTMPNRLLAIHGILVGPFLFGFTAYLYTTIQNSAGTIKSNLFQAIERIPKILAPWVIVFAFLILEPLSNLRHAEVVFAILKQRMEGISGLTTYGSFWTKIREAKINFSVLAPPKLTQAAERGGHLPLLIEPDNIDFIPYKPETVETIAHIFEMAYGVSFSNPPYTMRHWGGLSGHGETGHLFWEKMSGAQWVHLSRTLGVGGVITPSDWKLHLPILLSGKEFIFYRIRLRTNPHNP
jgi:hypothetical protein